METDGINNIVKPLKIYFLGGGVIGEKCHQYIIDHPLLEIDMDHPDILLSVLYDKRVNDSLLSLPKMGCINFHAAPLPQYRGVASCTWAILNQETRWEVTAHYMEPEFDVGDIIGTVVVPIFPSRDTAETLSKRSHKALWMLFLFIVKDLLNGLELPRRKQVGEGHYYSWNDFDRVQRSLYNPRKEGGS